MTPSVFKKYIVNQLLIFGECFAKVVRAENGSIKAIAPLKHGAITYTVEAKNGDFYYQYFKNRVALKPIEKNNLLHFKENLNQDGKPMSALTKLTATIGMDKGTTKFLQEYLNNMVSPSFILEIDSDLSMEKANILGHLFKEKLVGSNGAPLVLQKGLKAKEFNAKSLKDLDISLLRDKSSRDISASLGCPLHTVGLGPFDKEAETAFFENVITPILTNIEEELNYALFAQNELKYRFIRFNIKKKMRGNMAERIDYYNGLFNIGAITQNEIRALEDMDKIEGGDTPLILENYLPIDALNQQKKLHQENEKNKKKEN